MMIYNHSLLERDFYINKFSSSCFSFLYQTSVFSSQVSVSSLQMTGAFHQREGYIENFVELSMKMVGLISLGGASAEAFQTGQSCNRITMIQTQETTTMKLHRLITVGFFSPMLHTSVK